jgi:hypothetical protein
MECPGTRGSELRWEQGEPSAPVCCSVGEQITLAMTLGRGPRFLLVATAEYAGIHTIGLSVSDRQFPVVADGSDATGTPLPPYRVQTAVCRCASSRHGSDSARSAMLSTVSA